MEILPEKNVKLPSLMADARQQYMDPLRAKNMPFFSPKREV
jgi:hypothetical protein